MDKNQINQIMKTVSDAKRMPDMVFQLTNYCKLLLAEIERLEARHKADQKAIEEANQLAETYMKRCQELYDKQKKSEKEQSSLESRAADMVKRVHEVGIGVINLETPTWENISKIVKEDKLKRLETYSTKDLVDELKKREGVSETVIDPDSRIVFRIVGPATVLTVTD